MSNNIKTPDRRVLRTKKAIRNAFAQLLSEKDIDDITIKDISDTADINRKTFYNYYSGIYQIVDEIENEIVTAFEKALKDVDINKDMQTPYLIFSKLTAIINSELEFYSHLLNMNHNASLVSKVITSLKSKLKESFTSKTEIDKIKFDIIADYSISGMVSVYQSWFNSDRKIPFEHLSDVVSLLAFNGINGLLKQS